MKFADAAKVITHYKGSELARSERNDCSVRAFAGVLDTQYEPAHTFVAKKYDRLMRQPAYMMNLKSNHLATTDEVYSIDGVDFKFVQVPVHELTNVYKVKGKYKERKKTVKSFIQSHEKGNYLVFVSNHVFALKDGTIVDNASCEYKPTRQVIGAVKIEIIDKQLELDL